MPHSSDDQPGTPAASVESETPSATAGEAPDGANPLGPSSVGGEPYQPRGRRRRRRRRPPPAAASQGAAIANETTTEEGPPAGDTVHDTPLDAQVQVEDAQVQVGDAQRPTPPRHRRRRRRGPPRELSQQPPVSGDVRVDESGPPDPT